MSVKQTSWEPGNLATATPADETPYRGLSRYEADDEQWFFGREDITELIAFLAEQQSALPLMLVGASGAGKSSLLRAGLLPRLRAAAGDGTSGTDAGKPYSGERVAVYDLAVTGVPALAADMAKAVRALAAGTRPGTWDRDLPAAVIVDQFEAVFTLCDDEVQRGALISALCEVARSALVVLALRADCYGRAIGYPGLLRALQERQVVLGPMTAEQVRRVVTEPAQLAGAGVEDGLAEVVLADLAPADQVAGGDETGPAYTPGALPLLSHALLAAWRQAGGGPLTVAGYQAAGGISGALPQSADRAYESLSPGARRAARRLLPRLVRDVDGLPPTRTPVPLSELRGLGSGDTERVLAGFAAERIITVDAGSAYFTHDAVLTAWPRLREWIEEDADAQRAQQRGQLRAAASRTKKDTAREDDRPGPADAERRDKPRRNVRSITGGARTGGERGGSQPLRRAVAFLCVLVLVAAGLTAYAFAARGQAESTGQAATAAAGAANSRSAAFVAAATRGTDPAAAAQLAAAAYAISPTVQATSSVLDASATPSVARVEDSTASLRSVSVSPNGQLMVAAAADGSLRLWNIASAARPVALATLEPASAGDPVRTAAFSANGTLIAAGDGTSVRLWQVSASGSATPAAALAGPGGTVSAVAVSSTGLLAAGTADGKVRLWNVSNPSAPQAIGTTSSSGGEVGEVAFGAQGSVLAAGTSSGSVVLWHVTGSAGPVQYPRMPLSAGGGVTGLSFSGSTLAASGGDQVRLWTVKAGTGKKDKGASATAGPALSVAATAVAFSPDGKSLAAGTPGATQVWDLATRAVTASVPASKPVTTVSWAGTQRLAAGTEAGTIALIALPTPVLTPGNSPASVAYSPDGGAVVVGGASVQLWDTASHALLATQALPAGTRVIAAAFSGSAGIAVALSDGTVQLLNGKTLKPEAKAFPVTSKPGPAVSVGFSSSGALLATGAADGTVRLYDTSDPAKPHRAATAAGVNGAVSAVALSPDGATLAAVGTGGTVELWQVADQSLTAAGTVTGVASAGTSVLAFSADSKTLAVGANGTGVRLWDVADAGQPRALSTLATGAARSAAFSADSGTLAIGDADGSVWLWNVASPAQPSLTATLTDATGDVTGVAFSPNGSQLAAGDEDTVHLWDTSAATAASGICANLGQALTPAEWASYLPGVPYQAPCAG
jgi:WD40 repeat protein